MRIACYSILVVEAKFSIECYHYKPSFLLMADHLKMNKAPKVLKIGVVPRQTPAYTEATATGYRDATSSIMSNYDQLHRQCRTLENLFDSKLTSYAQLASSISRPGQDIESVGSSERWKDLELELDDLSVKVRTLWLAIYLAVYECYFDSWKKSTNN
jgi:hypothetical protein